MTSTTFFIIFIPILAILLLTINLILAPHNPYQEKDSAFECGFHSFLGQNRTQFNISFFIFGLLFLLFDLEILLVYPYSVSSYTNDIYGLVIMIVFFVLLTLGFIFELGKNALTIDSRQTSWYNNGDAPRSANTLLSVGWIQAIIIRNLDSFKSPRSNKYLKNYFWESSFYCSGFEISNLSYMGPFDNLLYTVKDSKLLYVIKCYHLHVFTFLLVLAIPYTLKINIFNYIEMLLVSIPLFIFSFYNISNNNYLNHTYLDPTGLSIIFNYLECNVTSIVTESCIPDNLTCLLLFIGIAMLMLNLILNNNNKSLWNSIVYLMENMPLVIVIMIFFFILNILVGFLNLNLINTSNFILFILSAFTRIIFFKIVFILIFYISTNNISIDLFSVNIKSILFMIFILYLNIFFIFPFIISKVPLCCNYLNSTIHTTILKNLNLNSLMVHLNKILSCNPIFHRLIAIIDSIKIPLFINRYSPFRIVYTDIIKQNFFTLTGKINRFLPFYIYRPFVAQHTINIEFNCKLSNAISSIYANSINFKNALLNLVNKYNNLDCDINLMCSDYNTNISLQLRDGSLKDFQVNSLIKTNKNSYWNDIFDFAKNELYDLKYNNNPCKDLLEYKVNMMEADITPSTENISNTESIFRANTVTKNAPAYDNDDQKIKVLESIEDKLYDYCMHRYRKMDFINNGKRFTIYEIDDEKAKMDMLPEALISIYTLREDIYDENYLFNYRNSNLVIYVCLQDLLGNMADPREISGQNKLYSIEEDIDPYVIQWLDLCGVHWLREEQRNFPAHLDQSVYDKHIHPYKPEVPNSFNTLERDFVNSEYLSVKQKYVHMDSEIASEANKEADLDVQLETSSDIDAEGETDPEFS